MSVFDFSLSIGVPQVARIQSNFRKQAAAHERALHAADVSLSMIDSDDDDDELDDDEHHSLVPSAGKTKKRQRKASRSKQTRPSARKLLKAASASQLSDETNKRVEAALDELGLTHRPLPASQLYGLYARLRRDIVATIGLENAYAQKQYQVAVLRAHLDGLLELLEIDEAALHTQQPPSSSAATNTTATNTAATTDTAATKPKVEQSAAPDADSSTAKAASSSSTAATNASAATL